METRLPRIIRCFLVIFLAAASSTVCAQNSQVKKASAQQSVGSAAKNRARIDSILRMAKRAKTDEDLTDALESAREAYKSRMDAESTAYLRKLIAWLRVSRGEKFAERAGLYAEQGNDELADEFERRALNDFEKSLVAAKNWRAYHNMGVSHAMLGEFEEALTAFDKAIQGNSQKFGNSYFNRGEVLFELGKIKAAEKDYDQAYMLDPQDVGALSGRAHCRYQLGQPELAIEDFTAALELSPEDATIYADRADIYAQLGEWNKAARDYRVAINYDRNLSRAYQSVAWLMATCPEEKYRNASMAVKAAQKAIALDGFTDFGNLDVLAAAQAAAKQFDKAQITIKRAMEHAPAEEMPGLKYRLGEYQANRPFIDMKKR